MTRLAIIDDHELVREGLRALLSSPYGIAPAGEAAAAPSDLQAYLDHQEREVLVRVLREANYNRTLAATRLGLNLRQIRYRIQRLGIVVPGTPGHADSDAAD